MAEKDKNPFGGLRLAAQKGLASIDVEALKEKAAEATGALKEKQSKLRTQRLLQRMRLQKSLLNWTVCSRALLRSITMHIPL